MLDDRAKELGRLIGQSDQYKAVRRANDALGADKEAVTLLQRMEQLRVEASQMMERGEQPTAAMETELDGLLQQVQVNPLYQRMMVAQENFDKIMVQVNQSILEGIKKGATSGIITLG